jgi:hypothetical protein
MNPLYIGDGRGTAILPPPKARILRNFANYRLGKTARALLGAVIYERRIGCLTQKEVAALVGVSPRCVAAALRLTPEERTEVKNGWRPLIVRPAKLPQMQLSKIVDELGLDRVLNLLSAFELTRAA